MLSKDSKIAVVIADHNLKQLVHNCLSIQGYREFEFFESTTDAYERASRFQFDLIIISMEMPDKPGVTLMQRLKHVGNYGPEPMFFLGKTMDEPTISLFLEYDVDYVLTGVMDQSRITQKLKYLAKCENSFSETELSYKSAKSAYIGGHLELSRNMVNDLIEQGVTNEKAHLLLGDISYREDRLDEASEIYQNVLNHNPRSFAARSKLARVHMARSQFTSAKNILDELVELNPLHLKFLENAGLSNYELGFDELAKKQMEQLEDLDETNKIANKVLTQVAIHEGDYSGAAKRLSRTHTEKEMVDELNRAGVKLSKENDFEGAIQVYEDCLAVVQDDEYIAKICYNLAYAHVKLKNFAKATDYCERSLLAEPDLAPSLKLLGQLKKSA